jgi:CRISPR-associated protein Csd1
MLLQRLVELASRDDSTLPFHRPREFTHQLSLTPTGELESRTLVPLVDPDATGRPRGIRYPVPSMVRTVGVAPNLAADDAQYVLGWADEDSKPARVAQCHVAFLDLTRRWADSDAGRADPVAQAVWAFYQSGAAAQVERDDGCTAKSGVLIRVGGVAAYKSASVAPFWAQEVARRKGAATGEGLCLVCGQVAPLLDTLPGTVPSRLVPGATNDAALVSINKRVFGYDLSMQLGASPVCISCGDAITAGLVHALDPVRSSTYGGQDSRLAWWTTEETGFDLSDLNEASEAQVAALLASIHRGRENDTTDPAKFCALTVGGNVARVMVRDWVEMPIGQLQGNVAQWFQDQEMVSTRPNGPRYHGLGQFTLVSGRWLRDRRSYAQFAAKGADRPDGIHRDLVRAALRKTPLPPALLAHLVHRVRSDGRLDDTRAALIRLILMRHPQTTEKPMPGLDPTNTAPTYVAGRLFATLEQIQYDVSDGRLNTTYGDRFFAGAIANPRAALLTGRRDSIAWLRKLRNSAKKKGAAARHEKELDALYALLDVTTDLPARTTLGQQSLFLLGYHHQRAHHFAAARAARPTPTDTPDNDLTDTDTDVEGLDTRIDEESSR